MQTKNANCESYCRRTLSSSWLSKINLKRNSMNYRCTWWEVRMRTANFIAEELWLSEVNFEKFTVIYLHMCKLNMWTAHFIAEELWLLKVNFKKFTIICLCMCELRMQTVHFIAEELWVSLITWLKLDVHDVAVKSKHAVCFLSRLMTL